MNDLTQPASAVEIIADAMEVYDLPYERMIDEPSAGEVAAQLLMTWRGDQREPILESDYATSLLSTDVLAALLAQSDRTTNLSAAYERIGERLVRAARAYIFRVHENDANEAERLLAQRRREYQRELTMRRAYE